MSNASFKDFQQNFPLDYALRVASYWEDYANYENGAKPVPMHWKKSRNTVKKSAKNSSASKNRHKAEQMADFSLNDSLFPDKNKTLILPMNWTEVSGQLACYIPTNIGVFMLEFSHKKLLWQASWENRKVAYAKNPFLALAKLLGQDWYQHIESGINISMYDLYSDIVFDYGQKPNVRNRTRKVTIPPSFRENLHKAPQAKVNQRLQWLGRTSIEPSAIGKMRG